MSTTRRGYLFAIAWLNDASITLLIFAITRQLAEYGYGILRLGLLGAAFSLAVSLGSIASGPLSDRLGREPIARGGLLITLSGFLLCATLPLDGWYFILAYGFAAVGPGFLYPAVIAWLNETASERSGSPSAVSRAILFFSVSWNLGNITGQVTAGASFTFDPRMPIYIAVAITTVNLGLLTLARPRQGSTNQKPGSSKTVVEKPSDHDPTGKALTPDAARAVGWVANIGGAFAVSLVLHLFSDLAVLLDIPASTHGVLLAGMRMVVIATYLSLHITTYWRYRLYPLIGVQTVGILGLVVLTQASTAVGVAFGLASLALLIGYNYFVGLYYGNEKPSRRGRGFASGMHQGTLAAGLAAGSLGGGIFGQFLGHRSPYVLGIAVLVLVMATQVLVIRRFRVSPQVWVGPTQHDSKIPNEEESL